MSSRVTSAIASRRARENLVRLLFRPRDQPPASASASAADPVVAYAADLRKKNRQHSYAQLRAAYIERVHAMHPDKLAASRGRGGGEKSSGDECHAAEFVELKNAWEEYRDGVRGVRGLVGGVGGGGGHDDGDDDGHARGEDGWGWGGADNFTMFGVGCSFADSPEERDRRREITDQACRGWFPTGSIPPPSRAAADGAAVMGAGGASRVDCDGGGASSSSDDADHPSVPRGGPRVVGLIDESMFVMSSSDADHPSVPRDQPPAVRGPRVAGLIDESMFVTSEYERRRPTASEGDDRSSARRRASSLVQDADKFRRKR